MNKPQVRRNLSRALWLHMLSEGGRWTVGGLAEAVGHGTNDVSGYLTPMANRGMVLRSAEKPHLYEVTLDCKQPRNVTPRDLLDHGLLQLLAAKETEDARDRN